MHNYLRNNVTVEFINAIHEKMGETLISVSSDSKIVMVE